MPLTAAFVEHFVVACLWSPRPDSDEAFHILGDVMRGLPTVVMNHAVIDVGETKTMAWSIAFSVNGREEIASACGTLFAAIESKGCLLNTRLTVDKTTQVFAVR